MNVVGSPVGKCLAGWFALALIGTTGSAQAGPAQARLQIDRSLQKILVLVETQASLDANREDARIRLQPLETELKELRLRRAPLEQELAAGNERIRPAEDRRGASDFERLLVTHVRAGETSCSLTERSMAISPRRSTRNWASAKRTWAARRIGGSGCRSR